MLEYCSSKSIITSSTGSIFCPFSSFLYITLGLDTLNSYPSLLLGVPKKGSYLSNMSKGAKPINIKLTKIENKISKLIAKDLKKQNIFFAGIDFIDKKLNGDINVTSPTGLKTLYDLSGINLAKTFWRELRA